MKNYPLEIAKLRLEEAALEYGKMCEGCETHEKAADRRKAYDSSLESLLRSRACAFYEASKSAEAKTS